MKLINYDSPYLSDIDVSDQGKVNAYIEAATDVIHTSCRKILPMQAYDTVFKADINGTILMQNHPIRHIKKVYNQQRHCMKIEFNGDVATYSTTDEALVLISTEGGDDTTTTFNFADYPTIAELQTAANAVDGWTVSTQSDLGGYPTADIVKRQYGETEGYLYIWMGTGCYWFLDDPDNGIVMGEFSRNQNVRFVYIGGYSDDEMPEDIKQVCAEIVKNMMTNGEGNITSERLGDYSYTLASDTMKKLPGNVREVIASYRDGV